MDNKTFKQRMIEDMFEILSNEKISNASKEHILDMYCWILTERKGTEDKSKNAKFKGCNYWSEAALEHLSKNINDRTNHESDLRHEHVVPRKLFRKYVNNVCKNWSGMNQTDKNKIIEKINNFFIGCVVTKKEADTIDGKFDGKFKDSFPNVDSFAGITEENLWNRYRETIKGHTIMAVTWNPKSRGWEKSGENLEINL